MRIDGGFHAPIFGLWQDPDFEMPPMGVVVLGVGWTKDGYPQVQFMRALDEGDDGIQHWVTAFTDQPMTPPWLWAECRFIHPVEVEDGIDDEFDPEMN